MQWASPTTRFPTPLHLPRFRTAVCCTSVLLCAAPGTSHATSPGPSRVGPIPAVEEAVATAWIELAPRLGASVTVPPPVHWEDDADVVGLRADGGGRPTAVVVDPRGAEEIERLLEATALAARLRLRVTLRTYALERAAAHVDRRTSEDDSNTFWDWLGWTGRGRILVQQQASFQRTVQSMREQTYRWLLARALVTAPTVPPDQRAERTARALVASAHWPFAPLVVAIMLAARENPRDGEARTIWLCHAAAAQYAGVRELRRDPAFERSLHGDDQRQRAVRDVLLDLDALNETARCGLRW